jgi:hypothetical protein
MVQVDRRMKIGGTAPPISQAEAGRKAGLSPDQIKQAIRVANIPADKFESLVESDNPPTVTQLAEMGKVRAKTKSEPKVTVTAPPTAPAEPQELEEEAAWQASGVFAEAVTDLRELCKLRAKPAWFFGMFSPAELREVTDFLQAIAMRRRRLPDVSRRQAHLGRSARIPSR